MYNFSFFKNSLITKKIDETCSRKDRDYLVTFREGESK